MYGEAVIASIVDSKPDHLVVKVDEQSGLEFEPVLIDEYVDDRLARRPFSGLFRFFSREHPLKDVVLQRKRIRIRPDAFQVKPAASERLNTLQQEAIAKSLRMETLLLVLGPPGSGKTEMIRELVSTHMGLDRKILVVANTNRAVDEALSRVISGPNRSSVWRIGYEDSVDEALHGTTLGGMAGPSGLAPLADRIVTARMKIKDKRVIGATISSLLSNRYDKYLEDIDLVVIDEAGQINIPLSMGALSYGRIAVLIGDHNQLPPIVQSQSEESRRLIGTKGIQSGPVQPLDVSLFESLYAWMKSEQNECLVELQEQHRMNDSICAVASAMWYDGHLRPATRQIASSRLDISVKGDQIIAEALDPQRPVIFVDIPLGDARTPRTNIIEARNAVDLVESLIKFGFNPEEEQSLAVISPYRAQIALLRRELAERLGNRNNLWERRVDTVDRFQGGEADVVIFSLASYTDTPSKHVADEHRLNVAMTRARKKVILLGNHASLKREPVFDRLFTTFEAENVLSYRNWRVVGG